MAGDAEQFLTRLGSSLTDGTFVKLSLANYKGTEHQLQRILARLISTSKGVLFSVVYRYETRDITKNYDISSAADTVRGLLDQGFRSGHLFTSVNDLQLKVSKSGGVHVKVLEPAFRTAEVQQHDRKKRREIDPAARYLYRLGITDEKGRILDRSRDKWRQINKYVEILGGLFDQSRLSGRGKLTIADMGSGKGYLTFAAYDHFNNVRGVQTTITGVESRQELVDLCNSIARECGYDRLTFEHGTIVDHQIGDIDILIALHACNTATDDAIYKGITSEAELIITAPCCHQEIRPQIRPPNMLRDILKHGTLLEREAETLTDGLRAMMLETSGYSSKVFEFVPVEHTPKNNMIVGTRLAGRSMDIEDQRNRIQALMDFYGISRHRLHELLSAGASGSAGKS